MTTPHRHLTSGRPSRFRRTVTAAWFWIKRYLPAEIAGTATMLVAGLAVASVDVAPLVVGIVGTAAESVGFYAILGVAVWREQRRCFPSASRVRLTRRVAGLLALEFGPAELLDTFLVRPVCLTLAVQLMPSVGWALIVGKLVADVVFYVLAGTAFRVTERVGIRGEDATA